jgi:hypothetical protein
MSLTLPTEALLALVFVMVIVVVYLVGKALATWHFMLTPLEWGASIVLSFSAGAFLVAYLWGNGTLELLAAIPVALAFIWWLVRLFWRSAASSSGAEAED